MATRIPAVAGGTPLRGAGRFLPVSRPLIEEEEIAAVTDCLRSGWIGRGRLVEEFEERFAAYKRAHGAVAVNSCTAALQITLATLGIGPGDEVIVPSMTFAATANSVVHVGAKPVLADCDPNEAVIRAVDIEPLITPRTRAVIVVHLCGRTCHMDSIVALCAQRGLAVIEDCAHAIEATWSGVPSGLLGAAGCFSFYPTKNVTTGDGGMVICRDSDLLERVRRLSLHGTTSDAWSRSTGKSDIEYEIEEAGWKCNMTDMEAALGIVQLGKIEDRWSVREGLWRTYLEQLPGLPLELPPDPAPGSRHSYHLFTVLLRVEQLRASRSEIIAALRAEGVGTGLHYVPVHVQPYYRQNFGYSPGDLPNSWQIGQRTLSLPLSPAMNAADVQDVCSALSGILSYFSK